MSTTVSPPLEKLVTLLTHARRGAFAMALYDRLTVRRDITAALHERLSQPVYEVSLSEQERNPIDLIRALEPKPGDVVCLCDLEGAFPEALGYLDLQREVLVDMQILLVCWVTSFGHRMLAQRAPNFYAFRTTVFDFTTAEVQPATEHRFVGRRRELRQLTGLLNAGGPVVLTGLGGVGKTALAQQVARRMRSHFVGGIGWVNCEIRPPLDDILLTAAIAFIGDVVQQFRPDERQQRLADALHDRPCLLVLDNFETVAEDSEVLRWLRTISAPSTALIVSRQRVPYLQSPTLALPELPTNAAVRLFTQQAHIAGWEGEDSKEVPRLCELVGNLPLAIELLAPRAAEVPLSVLKELVTQSLDALAREKDAARAERHQSIAACFRVSFDRLSEGARTLLTRLSVLPDGAAEHLIASFTGIGEWHQPLVECVRHSLLHIEQQRYRFHPLLRRFALAQLDETLSEWQRRFVAFFRQLVVGNSDVNNLNKLSVLDAEWRNALAAAEIAEALQNWDVVVTLSEYLGEFLLLRGRWSEREMLDQRALAASHALGDRQAEERALNNLGVVYGHQGRWAEAETVFQQSLTICRELGDRLSEGQTLNNLGNVYQDLERWKEAETAYQQSVAIHREFEDLLSAGRTLNNLGIVYRRQARWAEAETALEQSMAIHREFGYHLGEGRTLYNLGNVYQDQGRWAEAETAYQQSLTIFREFGDCHGEGQTLENLARLRAVQGDMAEALTLAREALQVLGATEDETAKEEVRTLVAEWAQEVGKQKGKEADMS